MPPCEPSLSGRERKRGGGNPRGQVRLETSQGDDKTQKGGRGGGGARRKQGPALATDLAATIILCSRAA